MFKIRKNNYELIFSKLLSTSDLFLFAEQSQRQINVTLKGEAFTSKCLSNAQGIYILQPNIVNGKTHWFNKNGQFAIWYLPKGSSKRTTRWIIGKREHLSQTKGCIISPDDVAEPQEATTWKYFDGTIWKTSNPRDVTVTNILNSKNLISINMRSSHSFYGAFE